MGGGDKGSLNWTKRGVIVALMALAATALCGVVAIVPPWVKLLEERGYDAGWLWEPLQWVQRWWPVLFAVALLLLVGCVVWWIRRQVVRAFIRLGELIEGAYLWMLSDVLSRPVRDQLAVRLAGDRREVSAGHAVVVAEGGRETQESGEALGTRVSELSAVALHVLEQVLGAYDPAHGGNVVWKPEFVWIDSVRGRNVSDEPGAMIRAACEELKKGGFFSRVQLAGAGRLGVSVELDPRLRDVGVLLVREWARDELEMR